MQIDPLTPLATWPDVQVSFRLPFPLNERLDALVAIADSDGARTNRTELVAAVLLAAPQDADALLNLVLGYRRASAREALIRDADPSKILQFRHHPRGPRRKKRIG